jgi:hypothetical protein
MANDALPLPTGGDQEKQQGSNGYAQASWAALQLTAALAQGWLERGLTKSANKVARANADAQNTVRKAQNELQAAESSYARWAQSVSNQRRLRVAGKQAEAAQQSMARLQDQRAGSGLAARVRAAEEQGALAARSSFAGIAGSSADIVAGTAALRAAIVGEQEQRTGEQQEFEIRERAGRVIGDAIQGLDNTAILSNLDMNKSLATQKINTTTALGDAMASGADFGAIIRVFAGNKEKSAPTPPTARVGSVTAGELIGQMPRADYSLGTERRPQGFRAPDNFQFQI